MRRTDLALVAGLLIPAWICLAQPRRKLAPASAPTDAPAPTMSSGSAGVRAASDDAGSGNGNASQATAALERYRQMWQRMSPSQQKAFVQRGGRTPEQYERMLKGSASQAGPGRIAPVRGSDARDAGKVINPGDLDSLSKSLQDLNAIRDGNLGRVQKDNCPPEIASRTAELKSRLQSDEFELNGGIPPVPLPAGSAKKSGQADPLAVAGDWFKRPADQKSAASEGNGNAGNGNPGGGKLLDDVLPTAETASATPKPGIAPDSPEAVQKRNALQEDITRIKTELAQLSGACAAPKP